VVDFRQLLICIHMA